MNVYKSGSSSIRLCYAEYGFSSNRCSHGQSYQVPQFQLIVNGLPKNKDFVVLVNIFHVNNSHFCFLWMVNAVQ